MLELLANENVIAAASLAVAIIIATYTAATQARLAREERLSAIKRESYIGFVRTLHGSLRGDQQAGHQLVSLLDEISIIANNDLAIELRKLADLLHENADRSAHISRADKELSEVYRLMRQELTGQTLSRADWEQMRVRFYQREVKE